MIAERIIRNHRLCHEVGLCGFYAAIEALAPIAERPAIEGLARDAQNDVGREEGIVVPMNKGIDLERRFPKQGTKLDPRGEF
jgi:hypothetical protein